MAIVIDRFWAKVDKNGPVSEYRPDLGPCWIWTGGLNDAGYGIFYVDRSPKRAHRISCNLANRRIPTRLESDHLCRVRECVNPDHVEFVTHKVNVLRGISPPALCAKKTECPQGHVYITGNTYIDAGGKRHCKICKRTAHDRWTQRLTTERAVELKSYHEAYRKKHRKKIIAYLRRWRQQGKAA